MRKNPNVLFIIGCILILSLLHYFYNYLPNQAIKENHRYTIAKLTDIFWPSDGPKVAIYIYDYLNKKYIGSIPIDFGYEEKLKPGKRIFVKFSPANPGYAHEEEDLVVPDSLNPPSEGWKKLPLHNVLPD